MNWNWVLGIDFGVRDKTSFTVAGWREQDPCVYIAESYGRSGMGPTDAAEEYKALAQHYEFSTIVGDVGGLGKGFAQEMITRHSIPVMPAAKQNKLGFILLANSAFRDGRIKIVRPKCQQLIAELLTVPWAENEKREAEGWECDCADSFLYAWRACPNYHERMPSEAPKPGSAEYAKQLDEDTERQQQEQWEREQREAEYGF